MSSTVTVEILRLQAASKILVGHVGLVLIVLGTVGDLLNIFVFIRIKALRQLSSSIFLLASFISSLVLLWTARFSGAMLSATGINLLAISESWCKARWYLGRTGAQTSFLCVCLASIDRYLMTSRNANYRRLITLRRAYLTVAISNIVLSTPFIPDSIYYSGPSCTAPNTPLAYSQFLTYFNLIFTNTLPVPILAVFTTLTWLNLRSSLSGHRSRLQDQVTRMMLAQFIMVFLTTLPNAIVSFYLLGTQSVAKSQLRLAQENLVSAVNNVVTYATHVASFYTYFIISRSFRENVRTALCGRKTNRVTTCTNTNFHQVTSGPTRRTVAHR